jgi:eukaryotic translation initiation factor 2C
VNQIFKQEPAIPIHSARPDQVERALKMVFKDFQERCKGHDLELLVVILPDNNGTLYGKYFSVSCLQTP